jgi:hypothetical protein
MKNHFYSLYQMILQSLTFYLGIDQEKKKAGRPPKVSDLQLCALIILSYITNTPVFTLAEFLIDPNIKSYHLFRKTRTQKVYRLLKEYRNRRILSILFAKLMLGKKVKLIVDGTILEVANLNRARTQRIKRFSVKAFWGKKKRNLYSEHYKEKVRFEEMYYGVLVMVVCDSEGRVYDLWFHPASYHEVRSLRIRYRKSKWLRFLVDSFGLMGDRGYRGCEYVEVCESKEQKSIRQVVEGVNSQIKLFNRVSRWRKGITLLAYLYGYAIGYSFFRKSQIWGNFSPDVFY